LKLTVVFKLFAFETDQIAVRIALNDALDVGFDIDTQLYGDL
jgi:hypothetical protein